MNPNLCRHWSRRENIKRFGVGVWWPSGQGEFNIGVIERRALSPAAALALPFVSAHLHFVCVRDEQITGMHHGPTRLETFLSRVLFGNYDSARAQMSTPSLTSNYLQIVWEETELNWASKRSAHISCKISFSISCINSKSLIKTPVHKECVLLWMHRTYNCIAHEWTYYFKKLKITLSAPPRPPKMPSAFPHHHLLRSQLNAVQE